MLDRSALFTAYNALRPLVRQCRLDAGRLNRGLGIAQAGKPIPYSPSIEDCACDDFFFRGSKTGHPCKHQIALLLRGAAQRN
jgi:hypothetical protein